MLRSYEFHREVGTGPLVNPFSLSRKRSRAGRAHAHHNPMQPCTRGAVRAVSAAAGVEDASQYSGFVIRRPVRSAGFASGPGAGGVLGLDRCSRIAAARCRYRIAVAAPMVVAGADVAAAGLLYWPSLRQSPLPQADGAQSCRGAEALYCSTCPHGRPACTMLGLGVVTGARIAITGIAVAIPASVIAVNRLRAVGL